MIFVVLPCYNEEPNLRKLIPKIGRALRGKKYTIIAVNDGSIDGTGDLLREMSGEYTIVTVTHETNMGLQAALRSGLLKAVELGNPGDVIVTMDADDTHDPVFISKMIEKLVGSEVVIASRYVEGGRQLNVPPHRVLMSRAINIAVRLLSGIPARDLTSGYRVYRWECIQRLFSRYGENAITSHGFEVSVELLVKVYSLGCRRISEVPIVLDYGLKEGASKMKLGRTVLRYLILLPRIVAWRFSK